MIFILLRSLNAPGEEKVEGEEEEIRWEDLRAEEEEAAWPPLSQTVDLRRDAAAPPAAAPCWPL